MWGRSRDNDLRDEHLRAELDRLVPAMPPEGEWAKVLKLAESKTFVVSPGVAPGAVLRDGTAPEAAKTHSTEDHLVSRDRRHRSAFAYAAISVAVVVLLAGLGAGIFEAVQHLGEDQPILVIGDDTLSPATSPATTGETTEPMASEASVATFRGNLERTGVYPAGGPSELPEVLWRFAGSGDPVVADGLVLVGVGSDDGDYLYALDVQSGTEKWRFPGVWSPPTVADGVAYAGGGNYLCALDIQTGQTKWSFQTGDAVRLSPAVSNGVVYFGSLDGCFYAVDSESGQERWKIQTGGPVPLSPAISEGVVYFSGDGDDGAFYAADIESGQVIWKVQGLGPVATSPAVSGGAVFVADSDGDLHALDIQTGQEKWTFSTDGGGGHSGSSPAVSGGVVYFGGADGYLYAVDVATGQEKWKFSAGKIPNWPPEGVYSSPSISGGVLYVGAGYTYDAAGRQDEPGPGLCALDIATGKELWRLRTGDVVMSSPAITDGVVYFTSNDGYLYALKQPGTTSTAALATEAVETSSAMFRGNPERTGVYPAGGPTEAPELLWKSPAGSDPAILDGLVYVGTGDTNGGYLCVLDTGTGQEKWKFQTDWWPDGSGPTGTVSSPAVSGGVMYFGGGEGYLYAVDITTGQAKWKFKTDAAVVDSPAISGGTVYFGSLDGYLYAVDSATGEELWRFQADDAVTSSPAISGGVIYFGSEGSGGYLYALDTDTGQEKWKFKPSGGVASTPAFADGAVYFGNGWTWDHGLYAVDTQTGQEKWKFETANQSWNAVVSPAAVSGGMVYFGSDEGHLYAVDVNTGQEKWQFGSGLNGWIHGFWSSPSISGEVVYVGDYGSFYALDAKTGQEMWRLQVPYVCEGTSPAISNGVVYVRGMDGYLYAVK